MVSKHYIHNGQVRVLQSYGSETLFLTESEGMKFLCEQSSGRLFPDMAYLFKPVTL